MKFSVSEVLKKASDLDNDNSRVQLLHQYNSHALREILRFAFDPRIEWDLPAGTPPFKYCVFDDQEGMLANSMKRMYLFLKGGNPNIKPLKREKMFLDVLEALTPSDADLLVAVKDKKMPYTNITADLVNKAFPGLLPPDIFVEVENNKLTESTKIVKKVAKKTKET